MSMGNDQGDLFEYPDCPQCGSGDVYHRKTASMPYRCRRCGQTFNRAMAQRAQNVEDATLDHLSGDSDSDREE